MRTLVFIPAWNEEASIAEVIETLFIAVALAVGQPWRTAPRVFWTVIKVGTAAP